MKISAIINIIFVFLMGYVVACGEKTAERSMQVGETAVITPVDNAQLNDSNDSYARKHQNTLITFKNANGKISFEDFSEVRIFENSIAKVPMYVFTSEDLKNMASTTGCSGDLKMTFNNNQEVSSMFCYQEFKYSRANVYVLKMLNKNDLKAFEIKDIEDDRMEDLLKLTIQFN